MGNRQPNILVVMADQLAPSMTSVHGHPCAKTPTLDRLAREGMVFDAAYTTCPVCVPARYSFLTGSYLATTRCYDNGSILASDVPTVNHYLNAAGYDTVLAGKAHFVGPDQLYGFNRRLMTNVYPTDLRWMPPRTESLDHTALHPNPIAVDYLGENVGVRQWSMLLDYDEEAVLQAIRYLATKRSQPSGSAQKALPATDESPFYLVVSLNHPHEPFHALPEHWDLYADSEIPIPQVPEERQESSTSMDALLARLHGTDVVDVTEPANLRALHRAYLASVSYVDGKIGELLGALERFGLDGSTIVIVVSDHGDMLGHRGMVQKRVFYEQSSRIELIVAAPPQLGIVRAGLRCADPVSIVDLAPTILDLAGAGERLPMDGRSLLPQLSGEGDAERHVFCENYSEGVTQVCLMVRQGPFKLTTLQSGERQLFNVDDDPDEWENLAGRPEHADIEARLERLLADRFDVEAIDRDARASYLRRKIIQASIDATGGSRWNYRPPMDVDRMYWRSEEES